MKYLLLLVILASCTDSVSPMFDYERYYDRYQKVLSLKSQIVQYKDLVKNENSRKEKTMLRTELLGIQQTCRDLASRYNSDASKFNRGLFRSRSLPSNIELEICE